MPPKRDGGKSTNDLQTDSDNTDNFRKWAGRPLDKPMWFNVGKKLLYDKVEGARDFITKGIVISEKHGTIYVSNVNHATQAPGWRLPCNGDGDDGDGQGSRFWRIQGGALLTEAAQRENFGLLEVLEAIFYRRLMPAAVTRPPSKSAISRALHTLPWNERCPWCPLWPCHILTVHATY